MKKLLLILFSISAFAQNDLSSLKGKRIWFYGDSITLGENIRGQSFPLFVSYYLDGIMMNKGIAGSTLMKQTPVDVLNRYNMETLSETMPSYDKNKDGLIFISFLTNDVRLFYEDYTLENFGKAIDNVVNNILNKGWNKDLIKFNIRYFITEKGVDYSNYFDYYFGSPKKATLVRYNDFADLLKSKLDGYGIQYFDHWNSLSSLPNAVSNLDPVEVHPNNPSHRIITDNIMKELYVEKNLNTSNFNIKDVIIDLEYFNLLGQRISEPKGITIVKSKKNGNFYTKKMFFNTNY